MTRHQHAQAHNSTLYRRQHSFSSQQNCLVYDYECDFGDNDIITMGLDLQPILPRALPSGQAVAVVGQRARPQQRCQNGRFFLLIQCL
jgi:hypothetical protein